MSKSKQATTKSTTAAESKISREDMEDYEEAFHFFDNDHDGFIGLTDVGKCMRSMGLYPSEAELEQIAKTASAASRSGKVSLSEFLAITQRHVEASAVDTAVNEAQMRDSFRIFDVFGNGMVNLAQLRSSLQHCGEKLKDEEIDELIREADIDAEGNVSYDELVKILCQP